MGILAGRVKPWRLLDLFCGVGGASVGYSRAGFTDIVGVDINPQPRYPFDFVHADAMTYPLDSFDVIHASPPCQDYSKATRHFGDGSFPRYIPELLVRFQGRMFVIENVVGSPLPSAPTLFGEFGLLLCGTMFRKRFWRHRLFMSSVPLEAPARGCDHRIVPLNPYRSISIKRDHIEHNAMQQYGLAMGVDWTSNAHEISESIPPIYTEFVGRQLLNTAGTSTTAHTAKSTPVRGRGRAPGQPRRKQP